MSKINENSPETKANILNYARKAFGKSHHADPVEVETVGGAEDGKRKADVVLKPIKTDEERQKLAKPPEE